MNLSVTLRTDRKLFTVKRPENRVDPYGLLCPYFAYIADVVHFHMAWAVADTAWHSEFRACTQFDAPLEEVNILVTDEKTIALFFPVAIVIECDGSLLFSVVSWDLDGGN